ncbi:NUDIX domain-containing protein [Oceanobacillus limi]|uniref:NUDIX domain-containing protein n=1 Tax=Oceanobacillus limi TaxID=930131 RepID=A0A1I0GE56_9BACI|nr:NUDIX hydrolase [Oceanobacillus limi]SET68535.1 NUDIX domain-containing protein [Oceanobacillus limi]
MKKGLIRTLAICIFKNNKFILVAEGFDSVKQEFFYRPIGGGVEFGERSSETIIREVKEEIDAEINELTYLGTTENIFTFNGKIGHEIVMVYDARFIDPSYYELESFQGIEDNGMSFNVYWKPLEDFQTGKLRLVPENLLNLIDNRISCKKP